MILTNSQADTTQIKGQGEGHGPPIVKYLVLTLFLNLGTSNTAKNIIKYTFIAKMAEIKHPSPWPPEFSLCAELRKTQKGLV